MYTLYTDCIEQERTEACVVQAGSGRLLIITIVLINLKIWEKHVRKD